MVLGCYYLTVERPGLKGEGRRFADVNEALLAYHHGVIDLQARIKVRLPADLMIYDAPGAPAVSAAGQQVETTVGRIIFNEALPPKLQFKNYPMKKENLRQVIAECFHEYGRQPTADLADEIKRLGFAYATKAGASIAISDVVVPPARQQILEETDALVLKLNDEYQQGLITENERYLRLVVMWNSATDQVTDAVKQSLDPYGSIYTIANSGATKAKFQQIRQLAGMRGLMADPSGRIIEVPIRGNFREGLTVLEYFISSHGARKGLADTALRTAESGYLTRRLIDVAQDVIVLEEDCGTTEGIWITEADTKEIMESLKMRDRLVGRYLAAAVPGFEQVQVNEELDEVAVDLLLRNGVDKVYVRSVLPCLAPHGVCRKCYGRALAAGKLVALGDAVGIIAAQSIGEPGTQLTMRTFHTGGIAGAQEDITQGLPRVEELFEARVPKEKSLISEIDGTVEIVLDETNGARKLKVVSAEVFLDEYPLTAGVEVLVRDGDRVEKEQVIARLPGANGAASDGVTASGAAKGEEIRARTAGEAFLNAGNRLVVRFEEREEREYPVPGAMNIIVTAGQRVQAGQQLTQGLIDPQDVLRIQGRDAVQMYLVKEVQKVYRATGVYINDKHIEVIVRQMFSRVYVKASGDTDLLPGQVLERSHADAENERIGKKGEPAAFDSLFMGITKVALSTESFLSAAS
jgi:DNA-directed RNA polymerase subunit beta'